MPKKRFELPDDHERWLASLTQSQLDDIRWWIKHKYKPERLDADRIAVRGTKRYQRYSALTKTLTEGIGRFFPKNSTVLVLEDITNPYGRRSPNPTHAPKLLLVLGAQPTSQGTKSKYWEGGRRVRDHGCELSVLVNERRETLHVWSIHWSNGEYVWNGNTPHTAFRTDNEGDLRHLLRIARHRLELFKIPQRMVTVKHGGSTMTYPASNSVSAELNEWSVEEVESLRETAERLLRDLGIDPEDVK